MKKLLIIVIVLALGKNSFGQDEPQNVIKINPLGVMFGSAQLAYEKALGEKSSVLLAPAFGFFKSGGFKYTTYGLGAELRFYLSSQRSAPAGLYVSPGAAYFAGQAVVDDFFGNGEKEKTNVSGYSAKAVAGHQWIWDSGFSLDINAGVQYFGLKFKDSDGFFANAIAFKGIMPVAGVGIGYAF